MGWAPFAFLALAWSMKSLTCLGSFNGAVSALPLFSMWTFSQVRHRLRPCFFRCSKRRLALTLAPQLSHGVVISRWRDSPGPISSAGVGLNPAMRSTHANRLHRTFEHDLVWAILRSWYDGLPCQ